MKIWQQFAGEHSANLRIIGEFKSEADATKAQELFDELAALDSKDHSYSSPALQAVVKKYNFMGLTEEDMRQANLCIYPEVRGKMIDAKTDETEIQLLVKIMLNYGAKIQIYSQHGHGTGV